HDDIRGVIAKDPDADFVMQEFLPHAKDQDIRVHMVWDSARHDYTVQNSYVRNRNPFELTPNLANGGFPTNYVLSPWEEHQALSSARVLAEGSPTAPLHVGLDFFPRQPITASTVERNAKLQELQGKLLGQGWTPDAVRHQLIQLSRDTAVIGEAASSAGTKGTELVLGEGVNPVTAKMVSEILHARANGVSRLHGEDTRAAAALVQGG
ncbi:MAG: hypothetical protein JWM86_821, partial [Thermoleophilia bacterium]|nr:hypothetical protein [Thermoleophilia bacterium]